MSRSFKSDPQDPSVPNSKKLYLKKTISLQVQRLGMNRPFSYSEKESQSNDTLLHFVEFSNVHNSDRSSNATRSNLVYKNV